MSKKIVIKIILAWLGLNLLAGIILAIFIAIKAIGTGNLEMVAQGSQMPSLIMNLGVNLILCYYIFRKNYINPKEQIWTNPSGKIWGYSVLLTLTGVVVIEKLVEILHVPNLLEDLFAQMSLDPFGIFTIVIGAPVFEEIIFRGAIMGVLLYKYTPLRAIIISSLIFGIIHFNPAQVVGAFALGLIFALVYYKTGSLLPCMFMHFLNNGTSTLVTAFYPEQDTIESLVNNTAVYWGIFAVSLLLFSFLIYKLIHEKGYQWKQYSEEELLEKYELTI